MEEEEGHKAQVSSSKEGARWLEDLQSLPTPLSGHAALYGVYARSPFYLGPRAARPSPPPPGTPPRTHACQDQSAQRLQTKRVMTELTWMSE